MKIIGITGYAGSGKDTVALCIVLYSKTNWLNNTKVLRFAGGVKLIATNYFK